MFTIARLFLSGTFERLLKAALAVLEWIGSDWRHMTIVALAVFGLWHQFWLDPRQNSTIAERTEQRDAARAERDATMRAYEQTVANYIAAAEQAQADAEANVARVKAEQGQINQETIDDYQARLAAARAAFERLRGRTLRSAPGDPGHPGETDLPGPGTAPGRADETPGDPQLPPGIGRAGGACPEAFVCLSPRQALIATEQAIQLDALIEWNARQAAIEFSSEARDD